MVPFATAVFEAYWGGDKDISQDSVLTEVCKKAGVDHVKFFEGIGQQAIKDQLKANTDEVMARGGFWFADHLCRQDRHVFRQRPHAADPRGAAAPESAGRLMPKAVVCRELGPPESLRLETFAAAPLAPGQVRVAIRAAGINFPDILMAAGEYQLKPPLPFTPGVEAAGDVVEVNAPRASRSATR